MVTHPKWPRFFMTFLCRGAP